MYTQQAKKAMIMAIDTPPTVSTSNETRNIANTADKHPRVTINTAPTKLNILFTPPIQTNVLFDIFYNSHNVNS